MLRKTLTAAALILGASVMGAASANAMPGYATDRLEVKAGPDFDYPTVGFARPGSQIEINGCLPDWSWCDVTTYRDRGWVQGEDVQAVYRGRRIAYGDRWDVPVFSFNFGSYWDSHYRGRPFYRERVTWQNRWNRDHGGWHDHDRGGWHDRDHGPGDWHDRNHDGRNDDHDGRDRDGDGRDRDHGDWRDH